MGLFWFSKKGTSKKCSPALIVDFKCLTAIHFYLMYLIFYDVSEFFILFIYEIFSTMTANRNVFSWRSNLLRKEKTNISLHFQKHLLLVFFGPLEFFKMGIFKGYLRFLVQNNSFKFPRIRWTANNWQDWNKMEGARMTDPTSNKILMFLVTLSL